MHTHRTSSSLQTQSLWASMPLYLGNTNQPIIADPFDLVGIRWIQTALTPCWNAAPENTGVGQPLEELRLFLKIWLYILAINCLIKIGDIGQRASKHEQRRGPMRRSRRSRAGIPDPTPSTCLLSWMSPGLLGCFEQHWCIFGRPCRVLIRQRSHDWKRPQQNKAKSCVYPQLWL